MHYNGINWRGRHCVIVSLARVVGSLAEVDCVRHKIMRAEFPMTAETELQKETESQMRSRCSFHTVVVAAVAISYEVPLTFDILTTSWNDTRVLVKTRCTNRISIIRATVVNVCRARKVTLLFLRERRISVSVSRFYLAKLVRVRRATCESLEHELSIQV